MAVPSSSTGDVAAAMSAAALNEYEKSRLDRIAANRKKMEELALKAAAQANDGSSPSGRPKRGRAAGAPKPAAVPAGEIRRSIREKSNPSTYKEDEFYTTALDGASLREIFGGGGGGGGGGGRPARVVDEAEVEELRRLHGTKLLPVEEAGAGGEEEGAGAQGEGTQAGGSQGAAPKAKGGRKKKAAAAADGAEGAAAEEGPKNPFKKRGPAGRPVDSGKGVRVQGGRVYDSKFGVTCHWCRQKTLEDHVTCTHPGCGGGGKRMPVSFCKMCLRNRHGEDCDVAHSSGKWVCPRCRGSCGAGCVTCCNCGPCRKKLQLEPTHQVVRLAKEAGFTNVHDYLVHVVTSESAEEIAARKHKHAWGAFLTSGPACAAGAAGGGGSDSDEETETEVEEGAQEKGRDQGKKSKCCSKGAGGNKSGDDSSSSSGSEEESSSEEEEEVDVDKAGAAPVAGSAQVAAVAVAAPALPPKSSKPGGLAARFQKRARLAQHLSSQSSQEEAATQAPATAPAEVNVSAAAAAASAAAPCTAPEVPATAAGAAPVAAEAVPAGMACDEEAETSTAVVAEGAAEAAPAAAGAAPAEQPAADAEEKQKGSKPAAGSRKRKAPAAVEGTEAKAGRGGGGSRKRGPAAATDEATDAGQAQKQGGAADGSAVRKGSEEMEVDAAAVIETAAPAAKAGKAPRGKGGRGKKAEAAAPVVASEQSTDTAAAEPPSAGEESRGDGSAPAAPAAADAPSQPKAARGKGRQAARGGAGAKAAKKP